MDAPLAADRPLLRAHLFGSLRLEVGGVVIPDRAWPRRSARALILLLLVTPAHRLPRDQVLDLLWPDASPRSADGALRKAVHALRRVLEPDLRDGRASAYLEVGAETVALRTGLDLWTDIDTFEAVLATARSLPADRRGPHLREALDLYRDDLLSGEPYADWANAPRERLRDQCRRTVLELADRDLAADDPAAMIPLLEHLLQADRTDERVLRAAMRAMASAGQRDGAVRWYQRGIEALRDDLDVEPEEETRELADRIRALPPAPVAPFSETFTIPTRAAIPVAPNALVGRVRDVERLQVLLLDRAVRLVTVTGPGGVGKTRLAQEAARQAADDFADGVCFVALAAVSDPGMVLPTIARALGIAESTTHTPVEMVQAALHDRDLLLVLDNLEQVLDAAPSVAALLEGCERLTVLATSRESLRVRAEHAVPLPPLSVPDSPGFSTTHIIERFEAVELFLRRVRAVNPGFALTHENAATVAGICRKLDGLPLAIELAAAQTRSLSPDRLLAGLADRFTLLANGYRDLPPRQQSLHAAISWSYHLLTASRRTLFRHLAVFAGGFTVEAAVAVIERVPLTDQPGRSIESIVDEGIAALVGASLLKQDADDTGIRFAMLESIREFGMSELAAGKEEAIARSAHARWFLARAEEAAPELHGPDQRLWLDRLEADLDNIRAALEWTLGQPDADPALRLAGALRHFWLARGYLAEGREWLERALARGAPVDAPARVQAIFAAGELSFFLNDHRRAKALAEEGLRICRLRGDARSAADALLGLGHMARVGGDLARAAAYLEEGIVLARSAADDRSLSLLQEALGGVIAEQGYLDSAETLFADVLRHHQQTGNERSQAAVLSALGRLERQRGNHDGAIVRVEEALSIVRRLRDAFGIATILFELGTLAAGRGDHARAVDIVKESLTIAWEHRFDAIAAECMGALASLAASTGEPARSARLLGATESFCRTVGTALPERFHDPMASGELDARAKGVALTPEQAVAEALGRRRPQLRIVGPATPEEEVIQAYPGSSPIL